VKDTFQAASDLPLDYPAAIKIVHTPPSLHISKKGIIWYKIPPPRYRQHLTTSRALLAGAATTAIEVARHLGAHAIVAAAGTALQHVSHT
jgi:hypothetical protein